MVEPARQERELPPGNPPGRLQAPEPTVPAASGPARFGLGHPWLGAALVFVAATLLLAVPAPRLGAWLNLHLYLLIVAVITFGFGWRPAVAAAGLAIAGALLLAGDLEQFSRLQRALFVIAALLAMTLLIGLCEALRRSRSHIEALTQERKEQLERLNLALTTGSIGTFDIELGIDPTDAVMQLWHLATELIDRERLTALVVRRLLRGEQDIRVEYRIVRANGTSRWLELRGHVACGADDRPVRLYGMTLDVTERQEVEEQYRQSQALFDKLFMASPFGAAQLNTEGHFLRVNPVFCELLGYESGQLTGHRFAEFTHPDDRAVNERGFAQVILNESRSYHLRKRFIRADGSVQWAQVSGNVVRGADGQTQFAIAIVLPLAEPQSPALTQSAAEATR